MGRGAAAKGAPPAAASSLATKSDTSCSDDAGGAKHSPMTAISKVSSGSPPRLRDSTRWMKVLKSLWISPRQYPDFGWTLLSRVLVNFGNAFGTSLKQDKNLDLQNTEVRVKVWSVLFKELAKNGDSPAEISLIRKLLGL